MTIWFDTLTVLPIDGSTVWIRVVDYYGDAVTAVYDNTTQTFTTVVTSIVIPAYQARRWKNV